MSQSFADVEVAVVLGAVGGVGMWVAWTGWRPPVEPLAKVLARFGRPVPPRHEGTGRRDLDARLAARVRRVRAVDQRLSRMRRDLTILDRSADDVAASVGAFGLLGFFLGLLLLVPGAVGLPLPAWTAGWAAVGGAAIGAAWPFLDLREQAARRRSAFQQALSAYCVSVDMCLQVGAGPEQALVAAADGSGWQFVKLRAVLRQAQVRNEEPWVALRRLGEETDVLDLVELAKSVEQVATRGAAVGDTVAGMADSIQARIASGIETDATRRTVRMAIPTSMLLMGFMLLAIYPLAEVVLTDT